MRVAMEKESFTRAVEIRSRFRRMAAEASKPGERADAIQIHEGLAEEIEFGRDADAGGGAGLHNHEDDTADKPALE